MNVRFIIYFRKKNPFEFRSKSLFALLSLAWSGSKVNSVQEACTKCFAVHISEFEIWQTTNKKQKNITNQNARFIDEKLKAQSLMFFVLSFFM